MTAGRRHEAKSEANKTSVQATRATRACQCAWDPPYAPWHALNELRFTGLSVPI